jgi:hypothetical protein
VVVMTAAEGLMLGQKFCDGRPRINRRRATVQNISFSPN